VPSSLQRNIVLEKAIKQKGHLGRRANKIPDTKLRRFPGEAFFLDRQGLQSLFKSKLLLISAN